jgi:N-acetyl-gamma-glutamyl-phosphate/LysW-gamma-L-alpha-aminoadipyl-6-phosphate reductase
VVEVKVGSSEGGNRASDATHHPERSGSMRSFAPVGHRHQAEVGQDAGRVSALIFRPRPWKWCAASSARRTFSCAAGDGEGCVEIVPQTYREEPFIRLVNERKGIYRYPEPKIVTGSNYADIGFALDEAGGRLVVISAIDNLMKGAAGTAVQAMNLMCGWPETTGLTFPGFHPI